MEIRFRSVFLVLALCCSLLPVNRVLAQSEEGGLIEPQIERAFSRKSVWRRIAIVAAGPAFNFLFAILAYYLMFLAGVGGIKPVIGEVSNPSPAHSAGIQQRDVILSVNGIDTPSWEDNVITPGSDIYPELGKGAIYHVAGSGRRTAAGFDGAG